MRVRAASGRILILGSFLALTLPVASQPVHAASPNSQSAKHSPRSNAAAQKLDLSTAGRRQAYVRQHGTIVASRGRTVASRGHGAARWAGISCVPFARNESGIDVAGNAWQWWDNSAGTYARGHAPEPGSVLSFSANGRMRMGHVAVVKQVINAREIEIDHANWWGPGMRGGVARNVPVVDVSENNDWTAVRVGLGGSGDFGSVYPTNGFIYDRPDTGAMLAATSAPAPRPALNPAPSDLRSYAQRAADSDGFDEVAEAPPARPASYHRHTTPAHHRTHAKTTVAQR